MTLALVFRHLCSELKSDRLERQDNQTLLLWSLNSPASLFPFPFVLVWHDAPRVAFIPDGCTLGRALTSWYFVRDLPIKIRLLAHSKQAMKRINITDSLMYVIWYSLFLKKLQVLCFFSSSSFGGEHHLHTRHVVYHHDVWSSSSCRYYNYC